MPCAFWKNVWELTFQTDDVLTVLLNTRSLNYAITRSVYENKKGNGD